MTFSLLSRVYTMWLSSHEMARNLKTLNTYSQIIQVSAYFLCLLLIDRNFKTHNNMPPIVLLLWGPGSQFNKQHFIGLVLLQCIPFGFSLKKPLFLMRKGIPLPIPPSKNRCWISDITCLFMFPVSVNLFLTHFPLSVKSHIYILFKPEYVRNSARLIIN